MLGTVLTYENGEYRHTKATDDSRFSAWSNLSLTSGTRYTIKFYNLNISDGFNGYPPLYLQFNNGGDTGADYQGVVVDSSGVATFTASIDATKVRFYMLRAEVANGSYATFDYVQLEEGSTARSCNSL